MLYIYICCYKIRTSNMDERWSDKLAPVVETTLEWTIKTDSVIYHIIFIKTKAQFS